MTETVVLRDGEYTIPEWMYDLLVSASETQQLSEDFKKAVSVITQSEFTQIFFATIRSNQLTAFQQQFITRK